MSHYVSVRRFILVWIRQKRSQLPVSFSVWLCPNPMKKGLPTSIAGRSPVIGGPETDGHIFGLYS
jgi:hypothetical protein